MSTTHSPARHPLAIPTRQTEKVDIDHHVKEWTSGTQGGGSLPNDFEWGTNPKQDQEENGSSQLQKRAGSEP